MKYNENISKHNHQQKEFERDFIPYDDYNYSWSNMSLTHPEKTEDLEDLEELKYLFKNKGSVCTNSDNSKVIKFIKSLSNNRSLISVDNIQIKYKESNLDVLIMNTNEYQDWSHYKPIMENNIKVYDLLNLL